MEKLRVGIVYGGRSGEHEVSLASAAAVFQHLDPARYEAVAIRIEKDGRWALPDRPPALMAAADVIQAARASDSPGGGAEPGVTREAHLVAHPGSETLLTIDRHAPQPVVAGLALDVVFPVLHGPYGEDGTVQGLLELANVPYVGAGVLASAVGMDKAVMKLVFAANRLPICDYEVVLKRDWQRDERAILQKVVNRLGFPVFVKPANLGSSVGISKAKHVAELRAAIKLAAEFDRKIVIEAAVSQAREIEVAVLGNDEPEASVPGEIITSREFYDYEAKYISDDSRTLIPAPLDDAQAAGVRALAIAAFKAIDGAGMARVDFLLAGDSQVLYLNEVNTIPGFTTISMYSKMWAASGLPYARLLDRLIALALERHREKQQLRTSL
ncbi:MAG: D-alanine--D-alanine ligase A [Acidobacteria bacterium]|nr:MAG: D-alanine--D-alanine ligase A [Acidobacteriota bacterium]PYR19327.1 MAG: D-alanine--D-alanine ligase A [Acidobacteriota bacterium]PYR53707.1 MAG: D-alanine--D-alanine ligase A [Acidobacteriota bacterium]